MKEGFRFDSWAPHGFNVLIHHDEALRKFDWRLESGLQLAWIFSLVTPNTYPSVDSLKFSFILPGATRFGIFFSWE